MMMLKFMGVRVGNIQTCESGAYPKPSLVILVDGGDRVVGKGACVVGIAGEVVKPVIFPVIQVKSAIVITDPEVTVTVKVQSYRHIVSHDLGTAGFIAVCLK